MLDGMQTEFRHRKSVTLFFSPDWSVIMFKIINFMKRLQFKDNIWNNLPDRPLNCNSGRHGLSKKGGSFIVICRLPPYKIRKKDTKFTYSRPANCTMTILTTQETSMSSSDHMKYNQVNGSWSYSNSTQQQQQQQQQQRKYFICRRWNTLSLVAR